MSRTQFDLSRFVFNALPDSLDFRDRMFLPTLVDVPTHIPLQEYQAFRIPILNQGKEGACTGFGLATVANYLLTRRANNPDQVPVSPRMFYEMAKRHDEWPGEKYSGSSARGAMKGWHKYGVCSETLWPSIPDGKTDDFLTKDRMENASQRPLGAYFRVNHLDLVAMHCALKEVGILYATATVHEGWSRVSQSGLIPYPAIPKGGHAFAIVAYDATGFWIQNSWGPRWGLGGFACVTYDDWLANGTDVWVARLGVPVQLQRLASSAIAHSASAGAARTYSFADLRPHIVSIGNDGYLKENGEYGNTAAEVRQIVAGIPDAMVGWRKKRILLYAHGGLVSEAAAVQRLADYRSRFMAREIYPLSFIWHTGFWATISNIITEALRRRRPEGFLDDTKDFMLDRLDDALEPLVRNLTGKAIWDEIKENAFLSSRPIRGARLVLDQLAQVIAQENIEVHIACHSAGSLFMAPLVRLLASPKGRIATGYLSGDKGYGLPITSLSLWAPACSIELFKAAYLPAIQAQAIKRFGLFVLSDQAEQADHCAHIYNKSLLYLVSNALEARVHIPGVQDGEPLLGLEKFIHADQDLKRLFTQKRAQLVVSPNVEADGSLQASGAQHHGDFDDDDGTVNATLGRILGTQSVIGSGVIARPEFPPSKSALRAQRSRLRGPSAL